MPNLYANKASGAVQEKDEWIQEITDQELYDIQEFYEDDFLTAKSLIEKLIKKDELIGV